MTEEPKCLEPLDGELDVVQSCGHKNVVTYTKSEVECSCGQIDLIEVKITVTPVKYIKPKWKT